jgi:cytochrome c-type biogenesis protein CcmH
MRRWLALLVLALATLGAPGVHAREAQPLADDEAVEQRLIGIAEELRCLVCQNESLAGSPADLAKDLRREIRTLIREGKTDPEIMEYLVSRYGDFVRYRPPLKPTTWLLWAGPFVALLAGVAALMAYLRRRRVAAAPLTDEERSKAVAILGEGR